MKSVKNAALVAGLSFGFAAVNAGQRNVQVDPQLIAVSTSGNFRITPPVSKALGVGHGEYVMFITNAYEIDQAIAAKAPQLVEFAESLGLEFGTPEASVAIHKELDQWAIAKGIAEFDPKGNARTATERLTKADKQKMVKANFDAALEAALASDNEELKDALNRDGITEEEQIDILASGVNGRELPKVKGSKVANSGGVTGPGTSLTFTDSNVWNQLKVDMGDDATKLNRSFEIDVEDLQEVQIHNGYELVTVKALILGESTDKEPSRVGSTSEESED